MDTSKYSKYIELALERGAVEAKIIEASSIKTASWPRLKCQYGCPNFGASLCCPPHSPTAEEMRRAIDEYSIALLARFTSSEGVNKIPQIERDIFLDGRYKAFGLKAGGCGLCPKCNLEKCIHPLEARPGMEAVGIDVYETVRKNGFSLDVVKSKKEPYSYFGLVLIE